MQNYYLSPIGIRVYTGVSETIMKEIIKWLLKGEPWVEYRTRVDLLEQSENEPEVARTRKQMTLHPRIQLLLEEM